MKNKDDGTVLGVLQGAQCFPCEHCMLAVTYNARWESVAES